MLNFDIYEVTREDYQSIVEQFKPEFRDVRTEELNDNRVITKLYSNKTGKLICSRLAYKKEENKPEKYYIFELPDPDERRAAIPKLRLNLETKEEVQAFFNAISELTK